MLVAFIQNIYNEVPVCCSSIKNTDSKICSKCICARSSFSLNDDFETSIRLQIDLESIQLPVMVANF